MISTVSPPEMSVLVMFPLSKMYHSPSPAWVIVGTDVGGDDVGAELGAEDSADVGLDETVRLGSS